MHSKAARIGLVAWKCAPHDLHRRTTGDGQTTTLIAGELIVLQFHCRRGAEQIHSTTWVVAEGAIGDGDVAAAAAVLNRASRIVCEGRSADVRDGVEQVQRVTEVVGERTIRQGETRGRAAESTG